MARTLRRKASRKADETINSAHDSLESLRNKKDSAESKYGRRLDDAESTLTDYAEDLGRQLRTGYEAGLEQIEESADTARRAVVRNPLIAVAGAFVGGLVISSLFRR